MKDWMKYDRDPLRDLDFSENAVATVDARKMAGEIMEEQIKKPPLWDMRVYDDTELLDNWYERREFPEEVLAVPPHLADGEDGVVAGLFWVDTVLERVVYVTGDSVPCDAVFWVHGAGEEDEEGV